jgi:hypothetical protein
MRWRRLSNWLLVALYPCLLAVVLAVICEFPSSGFDLQPSDTPGPYATVLGGTGSAVGLAVMTSIATSYGADQLGDAVELTNGYQAAIIAAAAVAAVGAPVALLFIRSQKHASAELEPATETGREADSAPVAA